MKEYTGIKQLNSVGASGVYCPKCGNYLEVVNNGWFHGELLFCPKEKKVFCVQLKDITSKAGKEFIEQCDTDLEIQKIKREITKGNYKAVKEFIGVK